MRRYGRKGAELKSGIRVYITDQSHPVQQHHLPPDAVFPGFVVTVMRKRKVLDTFWAQRRHTAEYIAQEFIREYETKHECGWR